MKEKKLNSKHIEVLNWIEDFKEQDLECFKDYIKSNSYPRAIIHDIYTCGNCSFFAFELAEAFPEGKIWVTKNFNHALVEIDEILFDISGIKIIEDFEINISDIEVNKKLYRRATDLEIEIIKFWSYKNGGPTGDMYETNGLKLLKKKAKNFYITADLLYEKLSEKELRKIYKNFNVMLDKIYCKLGEKNFYNLLQENGWKDFLENYSYDLPY